MDDTPVVVNRARVARRAVSLDHVANMAMMPLKTALQNSAVMGSIELKSIATPRSVATARME
jgi:hypothetical protein